MDGSPRHPNDLWIIAEPKTPGCQGRNQKELPEKFHGVPPRKKSEMEKIGNSSLFDSASCFH
jgi:hypothetical protein